jgi:hypothetical protein
MSQSNAGSGKRALFLLQKAQNRAIAFSMKKIILSVMLLAFTVAVNAGEDKTCSKDSGACTKDKVEAKSCCPSGGDKTANASCPMSKGKLKAKGKQTASKPVESPKNKS